MELKHGPAWDPEEEPYEDFLERLPEEFKIALAEGDAFLAKPIDGLEVMKLFFQSAEEENDFKLWMEFLDGFETEEDCKQKISEVGVLGDVATRVALDITERMRAIHMATCEDCQDRDGRDSKKDRALDAAKQAFLEVMGDEGDDDDWNMKPWSPEDDQE